MTRVDMLVAHIRHTLHDLNAPLPDSEQQYSSLPICVIDAVYSIGVQYKSTERTVVEWCMRNGWQWSRLSSDQERTISEFVKILRPYENRWEEMATQVFHNRQRTSTRSGILKAEAVYRLARTFQEFGIETLADVLKAELREDVRRAVVAIPGQGSGLSYSYLLMLAGNENAVKPDRMIRRFVAEALGARNVPPEVCERLVREASAALRPEFPILTPSILDQKIWGYQQDKDATGARIAETECGWRRHACH